MSDLKHELPEGFDPEKLTEAFTNFGKVVAKVSFTLRAQTLLGHALNGKQEELQAGLKAMPLEDRRKVLTAAQLLAGAAYTASEVD